MLRSTPGGGGGELGATGIDRCIIWAAMLLFLFPAVPTKTMVHAVVLTVFLPFLVKDPFV